MKIFSRTTRKINGRWYARIRYEDNNGNKRDLLRHSEINTKTNAKTLRVKLETELLEKRPTELVAGKITFRQLVEYAKTTRYREASYDSNGAVISGIRGAKKATQFRLRRDPGPCQLPPQPVNVSAYAPT